VLFEVKLPDIGEGVAEGEIVRWLVKPGDAVKEDQPLVEVMTDKATVEIPSPRTGTIAGLHVEEGQVVLVGTVLVTIEVAGATGASAAARAPAAEAASPAAPTPTAASSPAIQTATPATIQAVPAVRQLARQLGVAVEAVTGSGPGGRITTQDVERAARTAVAHQAVPDATGTPSPDAAPAPAPPAGRKPPGGPEERLPVRGLRRLIAEQMRRSIDTAAHFTFVAECDMTAVARHREVLQPKAAEAGVRLTYLAYVVKALIEPLRRFPLLNASLDDAAHEIVLKRYYNVGIATATDEGLTVPVLQRADGRSLLAIAGEIERLATAARAGKLKLDELQGATFTVTSTGARGGLLATPILQHPQVAILGVHEVKKKPAVFEDRIVARDMTNLSLSLDHRVVDGAVGADFLYAVVARLESLESWLSPQEIG
jgi:pyruvate dehydrogenase E2 component (dihydrolipoyllysine-residue acetyltransferase)